MKRTFAFFILTCMLLPSCGTALPATKPEEFTVQYTAASIPWLATLYNCAGGNVITTFQRGADYLDPQSANMVIRIGKPDDPASFAYQIATDELLVVVNSKNHSTKLTASQVYELFTGQIQNWKTINGTDAPVQVWVFPVGEDLQVIFKQIVLDGSPITSTAHMANNPNEMLQAVEKDANAIGIITQSLKTGDISGVYTTTSSLPVLAITFSKPQGTIAQILACLQK
jgi:hypothetical protein